MANTVKITFAGEEKDLVRATKSVDAALGKTNKAFDDTAAHATKASARMESAAEAADEVDTLGSKATSSLGALSSGFELLGGSSSGAAQALMTASLATDAMSGAGEAAFIVTNQLKSVVDRAKTAWAGFSTATKASAVALGVAGAALIGLGVVMSVVNQRTNEIKGKTQGYIDTLDELTGATTRSTRELVYRNLVEKDAIKQAQALGISSQTLVSAALGERDAINQVNAVLDQHQKSAIGNAFASDSLAAKADKLRESLTVESGALSESEKQFTDQKYAIDGTASATEEYTAATDAATKALHDYAKAVQDQFDPMANLVHRLDDVKTAQKEYDKAVKEHGRNSREAREANLKLAEAVVTASGAAVAAGQSFDGELSPALHNILRAGGLTEKQIADIEKQFRRAKAAGEAYSKTYKATAILQEFYDYRKGERSPSGKAVGGNVMAGEVYKINENGTELFARFGSNGTVFNAAQTASILAGHSGGAATPMTGYAPAGGRWTLEVRNAGVGSDDFLYQLIQRGLSTGRLVIRQSQIQQGR